MSRRTKILKLLATADTAVSLESLLAELGIECGTQDARNTATQVSQMANEAGVLKRTSGYRARYSITDKGRGELKRISEPKPLPKATEAQRPMPRNLPPKFPTPISSGRETIEQFLARGGRIQHFKPGDTSQPFRP